MSSVSKSAGAVPVHKSKAKAAQTRRGLLYALPDWLMIIVLFFVPIVLLVVMACSRWSLLGGNRGVNFPDNFVKVFENKLFLALDLVHARVHRDRHDLPVGPWPGHGHDCAGELEVEQRAAYLLPAAVRDGPGVRVPAVLRPVFPAGGPCHQDSELVGPDAGGWFWCWPPASRPCGPRLS